MSEANILNPTAGDPLNPDQGYSEGLPELHDELLMDGGDIFTRQTRFYGRIYELVWLRRAKSVMHALRQWEEQYRRDFFTFIDYERTRRFSGRLILDAAQKVIFEGNERWTMRGRFIELVGKPMNTYPTDWSRDAIFIEERDGSGTDLVVLTGTGWFYNAYSSFHGGAAYTSSSDSSSGQTGEWEYFGYGCRVWFLKDNNRGVVEVTVTRVSDGVVVYGPTNTDLYNATEVASAALVTKSDLPLGRYRVKVKKTGTKNASSSGYTVEADAIEVMR